MGHICPIGRSRVNVDVNLVTVHVNLMCVMYSAMLACRLQ